MKKSKLHFEKFQILTLRNLHQVKGGTGEDTGGITVTSTDNHQTTDPNNSGNPSGNSPTNSSEPCRGIYTYTTNTGG